MEKSKYETSEDIKKVRDVVKSVGLILLDSCAQKAKSEIRIVMDISALPEEYKELSLIDAVKKYEEDFGVKIIPVDTGKNHNPMIQVI